MSLTQEELDQKANESIEGVQRITKFPLNDPELLESNKYFARQWLARRVWPDVLSPGTPHNRDPQIVQAIERNWPKEG